MQDGFARFRSGDPVVLEHPRPIHTGTPFPPPSPASPAGDPGVRQPFVNASRDSRLTVALGAARAFTFHWKADLPHEVQPRWVLQARERIAVAGPAHWQLFDLSGAFLGQGMALRGSLTLDPERSVFYLPDLSGSLAARKLVRGEHAFYLDLLTDKRFLRSFIARRGHRLVAVSTEVQVDMSLPVPENSVIEVIDLGDPVGSKPGVVADLTRKTRLLLSALRDDTLVLAAQDRVYFADLDLHIRAALAGSFLPLAMSVDEGGRVYLLVRSGGQTSLWLLAENGERLFSFPLPVGDTGAYPPILGYDHTAFLLAGGYIFAVAPDGRLEWSRAAAGELAGAVVTADGFLLVTEGSEVAAYNARGEREVLFTAAGDRLTTPPILTAQGDLLVASNAALYCLTAR